MRAEVEARLAAVTFPIEYHAEVRTASTGEEAGVTRVLGFTLAAAIATLLLLQAAVGSWRLGAVAFASLPVMLVGGVAAAVIAGGEVSLGSLVGFLVLLGLSARTVVALMAELQRLEREAGGSPDPALVVRGCGQRLAPAVMTASAVAAVMLPFAVLGARPGLEIVHPMAIVILGGLVSSTLAGLLLLPAAYLRAAPLRQPSLVVDDVLAQSGSAPLPAGAPITEAPAAAPVRLGRLQWARTRFGGGLVPTQRRPPLRSDDTEAVPDDPQDRA